ncbi:class I SAM-dependent methyltransferase [Natronomonas halophila]|uniref:class I SAM-dependent methyltransferase n=1 Tax=Natronomonas halophila TaxID=2747817 RepID=UPI0015B5FFCC|nr:class I SAM-dependent methyltransferase [Natronomonas halophila]QLD85404.1 class I SAM-dependent methyltransferase [Natronomonas halophila]
MDEFGRTRSGYESASEAYVEKYLSESIAARFGEAFLDAVDGPQLLDIGCGPGADIETFAADGFDVTGLDITRPFLREADDRLPESALVQGDMRRLPFDAAAFDGVWASASFHHVPRRAATATLREFRRVLRSDGVAYISVKREGYQKPADQDRHFEYYRPDGFRSLIGEGGLRAVEFRTGENWLSALAKPDASP